MASWLVLNYLRTSVYNCTVCVVLTVFCRRVVVVLLNEKIIDCEESG